MIKCALIADTLLTGQLLPRKQQAKRWPKKSPWMICSHLKRVSQWPKSPPPAATPRPSPKQPTWVAPDPQWLPLLSKGATMRKSPFCCRLSPRKKQAISHLSVEKLRIKKESILSTLLREYQEAPHPLKVPYKHLNRAARLKHHQSPSRQASL